MSDTRLVPVHCFLHRIFPADFYGDMEKLVQDRIFKPRKDSEPISMEFPFDWESDDKTIDRNWRMQLQGWTFFHTLMNIFDDYKNKEEIIDFLFDTLADWWRVYGQDPEDIVTTRMPKSYAWYDMSVGFRALVLSFFINRINIYEISLSDEKVKLLEDIAAKHVRHLLKPEVFSMNNHGLFQSHGLVGLLRLAPYLSEDFESDLKYAVGLVEQLIVSQFGDIGVHLEHSPHYHFYALNSLKAQIDSGWYDEQPRIKKIAQRADGNSKWLVDPLKRPICVGDSILTIQKEVVFPNTHVGKYVLSDFYSAGYSIVRSGWGEMPEQSSMLFFTGAYHTKSHKHRDCLSFDWFDRGRRIICDSGKYGYKSDIYRNYFLSNRAHNTVEIEGFDILKIKPYGSVVADPVEVKPGIYFLKGGLDYPAVKQFREIYFKPGSWLIIKDELSFARERGFKQWFHLDKDFVLVSSQDNFLFFSGAQNSQLIVECMQKDLDVELHYGDKKNMQGFLCEKDYHYMPSFTVGFKGSGKEKEIFSVLSLSQNAHDSAKKFFSEHFSSLDSDLVNNFQHKKEIIRGVENVIFQGCSELVASREALSGEKTFQVVSDNIQFSFYGSFKKESKRIAVFLPGASSRKYGEYDFQRHSWGKDFESFDCVFFSDPSIKSSNDLTIGWFQCSEEGYGVKSLKSIIDSLLAAKGFNEDQLLIFGSSAGGFVSLKLSEYFKKALVVAINPQVYLYNYTKSFYEKMVSVCYEGRSPSFLKLNYLDRITYSPEITDRTNPVFIFQNVADEKHYLRHFKPLSKTLGVDIFDIEVAGESFPDRPFQLCVYQDEVLKHAPPNKNDTMIFLDAAFRHSRFL